MNELTQRCMVSGTGGHVVVTPAGRVILTETAPALGGEDIDRITDDVGVDVALRTLGGTGGTVAMLGEVDGRPKLTMTGRVAALIELPSAHWFVAPTGTDGHTVGVPGDALRFTVGLGATVPADLAVATSAQITTPAGQQAGQLVVDLAVEPDQEPTPVGLDVVDLNAPPDVAPAPLPVAEPAPGVAAPAPAPPVGAPPAPVPAAQDPAVAAGGAPGDGAEPSNWVIGIRCPVDHHNHPDAEYCSQCGRKMGINATAVFVKGPRPPVGLFLLDDGGAIPVATDLLIGRDPTTHDDVRSGHRQAVMLTDSSNVVSRHHVAVTLQEWDVLVSDLGSANGTTLVNGETGLAATLAPNQAAKMEAGDAIRIGPRTLRLELHHVPGSQKPG